MAKYRVTDHPLTRVDEWDPTRPAERINANVLLSRCGSFSYLVTTSEGDVLINTGTSNQGERIRERYEQLLERPLALRKILITQSHPDQAGGWAAFASPGVETIVQREFPDRWRERNLLIPFFTRRFLRILGSLVEDPSDAKVWTQKGRDPENLTLCADEYRFDLGGTRFELYSAPSGETLDSQLVWLPDEGTLFIGNWMGALYGAFPHFYTLRGDRDRSVTRFLRDISFVMDLKPQLLLTGHGDPIEGEERIARDLKRVHDAVDYVYDKTVAGMNEGESLWALMRSIELPPSLQLAPGRGPTSWYVRSIWEELTGWFRQESTTELYDVPPSAIWADVAELAGGVDKLAERAQLHLNAGRPLEALHFTDIALSVEPKHSLARDVEAGALEELIDRSKGLNFDEIGWLESELKRNRRGS